MKTHFAIIRAAAIGAFLLTACSPQLVKLGPPRYANMQDDLTILTLDAPWNDVVLNLDQVIEIANQRNLDLLVLEQQVVIQDELVVGSVQKWLPQLIYNQEISGRNRNTGAFSESLDPTIPPAPPSISSTQNVDRFDITLTWNLLDFGISMLKARQEANKTLILQMGYEKERQKLILEIVKNYWRAIVARYAARESVEIMKNMRDIIRGISLNVENQNISWLEGYRIETDFIRNMPELFRSQKEYQEILQELAGQMGIPLGTTFELAEETEFPLYTDLLPIDEIEEYALMYRPELYSGDLQELVKADDVKIAMLSAVPGVSFFSGNFYDGNKFLIFDHWLQAGLRVSFDLFRLPERMTDIKVAKYSKDLVQQQRIALSFAVISQVRIAYLAYLEAVELHLIMKELSQAKNRLATAGVKGFGAGDLAGSAALTFQADALVTEIETFRTYGEVMFALERLNNALGIPRFFVANALVPDYPLAKIEELGSGIGPIVGINEPRLMQELEPELPKLAPDCVQQE